MVYAVEDTVSMEKSGEVSHRNRRTYTRKRRRIAEPEPSIRKKRKCGIEI